jgi:hypothetical protein
LIGVSGAGVSGAGVSGAGVSGAGVSGAGVSGVGVSGAGASGAGATGAGNAGWAGGSLSDEEPPQALRINDVLKTMAAFNVLLFNEVDLTFNGLRVITLHSCIFDEFNCVLFLGISF